MIKQLLLIRRDVDMIIYELFLYWKWLLKWLVIEYFRLIIVVHTKVLIQQYKDTMN